jgi:hypothetical protein
MKKLLLLLLLSTLFLSCSENSDDEVFEPTVKRIAHHYKQYYEEPIVIDASTTEEDIYGYDYSYYGKNTIQLGSIVYQQRYQRNEVIDTLTIDLSSFDEEIELLVLAGGSKPNQIEAKYITVNYLKIIGFYENPNLEIRGDEEFDKITIYNSNVPVEDLNRISRTNWISKDMFQKEDYERKEWSFQTYVLDNLPMYASVDGEYTDGYIGFIGYDNHQYKGLKLEIVDIVEHYD